MVPALATEPLLGLSDMEKSKGLVTVKVYVVVLVWSPLVAIIVIVDVPTGVDEPAVMVIMLVNDGFPDDGSKLTDAPDGIPKDESETGDDVPLERVTVTVAVMLSPCSTLPLLGSTDTEKSNGSTTVKVKVAVLVKPPPAAFIVIV